MGFGHLFLEDEFTSHVLAVHGNMETSLGCSKRVEISFFSMKVISISSVGPNIVSRYICNVLSGISI